MEASAGLVAGSHNRNELVVIRRDGESGPRPLQQLSGQICQICGDDVGLTVDGELFVACNECAFPICRTCYEYERKEGNQVCPQCKTRFKRLKGCARVEGDEEEDDIDDVENEFNFDARNRQDHAFAADAMLHYGRASDSDLHHGLHSTPLVPLLTNGQMVDDIPPEQHALVPSFPGGVGGGKRIHPLPFSDHALPVQPRSMDPSKDLAAYGYGSIAWKERMESWKQKQDKLQMMKKENSGKDWDPDGDDPDLPLMDEARQPLSRKMPISSSQINPYRMIIIIRLVVLGFFFHYRVMNPVKDAYALWLISVICEIWFGISWILDQFPKWLPIDRETYLDRLSLRYEKEGQPSQLSPVDIFVSTVDPLKEPPLVTANTVLSILAVDYPIDKISCYVSDDGAAMLTFEALSETSEFAKKWVPFCKKFNIEPRAPEWYFAQKMDYLKDKVLASFVKERRAMKREYEEFKVRINALVAKAQKVPEEGWTMQDGTLWPGNNVRDHPGMIQVFLGQSGGHDTDGNELPRLVYVSREKRPGFNHHKKAGAMNALVRVSAVLTNAPYLLNLDCDHYFNNSKALREAMCFMMDPLLGKRVCYVQFPQRFDGIDRHDRYANRNTVFFDINMKGLDGIQGPIYVGTGCVFRRQAFYGFDAPKVKKPPTRTCNCLPKWCCCCSGKRKKKKTNKPKSDMKKKNSSLGASAPVCALEGLKWLERLSYINATIYPWTSIPLLAYCTLPAVCLLTGKFITPELSNVASLWFLSLFICIFATGILEMRWSGVGIDEWWRNEQFWVIGGVSAHLFAVFQGLLKVLAGVDTNFTVTSKAGDDEAFSELYAFKWTTLLIPPTTLLIINLIGVVAGVSNAINNGYESWGPLFGKLFFAFWVIVHLYPFLKGLLGRQNRTPTIIIVWSILLASIFSLLWVRIDPFLAKSDGPLLEECGLDCN
ncbi:hypothetical protein I3760_08G081900 [Carya illinoinensis]|uniref:Cellulose synthase n=1 Tax=Carya illinoinensis TaxID=32201 RepID=A0A922JAL2_CARIL|nr:hypothetical protein I3760_08G081900 [Carya illinoinensis]KAG6699788.1 hypothetical protein I3842_08G081000 [Carya illinoinensis]